MTSQKYQLFKSLHNQDAPLLIGNVWNVPSAVVYQKMGFKAVGTSSAAVANSLGYEDGENIPFDDYLFIIKRIAKAVNIPLSVDLEAGFGKTPQEISDNILKLIDLGVVGINLEDSIVQSSKRTIAEAQSFYQLIKEVSTSLRENGQSIFLNIRCDVFLLNLPDRINEAIARIKLYEKAGIDGLFFPGLTEEKDIEAIVNATSLPVNVMCMPQLPDFNILNQKGVKRISMGNFLYDKLYNQFEEMSREILNNQSFRSIF